MVKNLSDVAEHASKRASKSPSSRSSSYSESSDATEVTGCDGCATFGEEKHICKVRISQANASEHSFRSISHTPYSNHEFYKPTANKSWVLILFLFALGICIVLLELAVQYYPDAGTLPKLQARDVAIEGSGVAWQQRRHRHHSHLLRRQAEENSQTITSSIVISSNGPDSNSATTSLVAPGEPNPKNQITVTTKSSSANAGGSTGAPNPVSQISVTTQPTSSPLSITVGQPAPDSQVSITKQSSSTTKAVLSTPDSQLSIATSDASIATYSGSLSASLVVFSNTNSETSPHPASATTHVDSTLAHNVQSSVAYLGSSDTTSTTFTDYSQAVATTLRAASLLDATTVTDPDGRPITTPTTTDRAANEGPTAITPASSNESSSASQKKRDFTQFTYFLAMYLPNIISVLLQSSWLVVLASFTFMEPFYQLSRDEGALAKSTLTADYLSADRSMTLTKDILDRHWVLALAGQVQFALALTVIMDAGAFNVVPTAYCKTQISDHQPCDPQWVVNVPLVRAVEVFLVAAFSTVISIIFLDGKRQSGLYTDPAKIATMADLLVHKPLIEQLRDIPSLATKGEIGTDLHESRYALGTFMQDGRHQYGIVKLQTKHTSSVMHSMPWYSKGLNRLSAWWEHTADHTNTFLPFFADFLCMALAVVLFVVVLTYRLLPGPTVNHSSFNVWMSSGANAPRIVLSAMACAISFLVKHKERTLRLSYPYTLMAKGPQPAAACITSSTYATAFTSLLGSIKSMDITPAFMAISVIFADIVLMLIPGIPQCAAQTAPVYLSSTYICLVMLAVIFGAHARATFKEWRRGHRSDCPDTLAAVLVRLCASKFIDQKNKKESAAMAEMGHDSDEKQHARYAGVDSTKRYRFGWMEGVDGIHRYMVDEDIWARRKPSF